MKTLIRFLILTAILTACTKKGIKEDSGPTITSERGTYSFVDEQNALIVTLSGDGEYHAIRAFIFEAGQKFSLAYTDKDVSAVVEEESRGSYRVERSDSGALASINLAAATSTTCKDGVGFFPGASISLSKEDGARLKNANSEALLGRRDELVLERSAAVDETVFTNSFDSIADMASWEESVLKFSGCIGRSDEGFYFGTNMKPIAGK